MTTTPARLTVSLRWDDICLVIALGTMLGLFFVIGLWCFFVPTMYLLGGLSYALHQGGSDV